MKKYATPVFVLLEQINFEMTGPGSKNGSCFVIGAALLLGYYPNKPVDFYTADDAFTVTPHLMRGPFKPLDSGSRYACPE